MNRRCKHCYQPLEDTQTECTNCGATNPLPVDTTANQPGVITTNCTYYKFLIWFWLIASCMLFFLSALGNIGFVTTHTKELDTLRRLQEAPPFSYYGYYDKADLSEQIKEVEEALTWKIIMALAAVIMGIWALNARANLANCYYVGISRFYSYLIGCIVYWVLYGISLSGGAADLLWWQLFTGIPAAVINLIMLGCSKVYFDKRYEMFI